MTRNEGLSASGSAPEAELMGIQELATSLGITHRTLRFYEDKGLIKPQRIGTTRVYSRREFGRMQLILRGKRLGFSIREIAEFLDLYEVDPYQTKQVAQLLAKARERRDSLRQQRKAIDETIRELDLIEKEAAEYLARA